MVSTRHGPARSNNEPELHEIRVEGHLHDRWTSWVDGLTFTRESDGTTTIKVRLADQPALHGLLNRLRDLNLPIISVRRASPDRERGTTMNAIVQDRYGSADVLRLQEVEKPGFDDDGVLIRVQAAGVQVGDWHVMTGQPYLMRVLGFGLRAPKARVRGMDVAGTIEAAGKNVTRFRPGDEVFGVCDGAFAEYASAREDKLALKPANLTFEQAAAVPTSASVALKALRDAGGIKPGQKVLIVGASGGVGLFAVQIAKSFGAEVTGVCGTTKLDLVRSLGADQVVDYSREDFTRSGQRYDLILDMVGDRSLTELRRALTPRGTLVLVGGEGGNRWLGALSRSIRGIILSPFVSQKLRMIVALADAADLRLLQALVESGKVTPVIDRTYPLSDVPGAITYLHRGHPPGKIVIAVEARTAA